jgi:dihydroorotase
MPKKATEQPGRPLLLRGGRILDPASGLDQVGDVLLEDGRIKAVESRIDAPAAQVIDVAGKWIAPGFIDMHVHLREPGGEDAETIASGTRAAAAGGFTAVAAMPNTSPVNDDQSVTRFMLAQASSGGVVRVHPIGCVTKGMAGEELTEIGDLVAAGCVALSDDGKPVASAQVMRRALEYCRVFEISIIDHCEEPTLSAGAVMNEGPVSTALGLRGMPAEAEEVMVDRNIRLAALTGGRIHIAHLSTRGSIAAVRLGKEQGIKVTAEVAPHHLLLTDEEVKGYDTNYRMNPPLRNEEDRQACVEALADGTIDAVATDHAPHTRETKNVEFNAAPNGVIGLESAIPVLMDRLVATGKIKPMRLVESLTAAPAAILNLGEQGRLAAGALADITVVDPDVLFVVEARRFRSLSRNTPFDGWRCRGGVAFTIVDGCVVHDGRDGFNG